VDIPTARGDNVDAVAKGEADLALGVFGEFVRPAGFCRHKLYAEDLVCVLRRGHPALRATLTPKRFAALSHVLVTITRQGSAPVDATLAQRGLSRHVALRLPHFLVAPQVVVATDVALSLPCRLAVRMAETAPVTVVELPFKVAAFFVTTIWHERTYGDAAHAWLSR
jgi:DNA-binding transcriptional LysR family regulator